MDIVCSLWGGGKKSEAGRGENWEEEGVGWVWLGVGVVICSSALSRAPSVVNDSLSPLLRI